MQFGLKVLAGTVIADLTNAPFAIENELGKSFDVIGQEIVARARKIVPVRTGKLRTSISYQVGPGVSTRSLIVGAGMPYASFVEKKKPYLRPALASSKAFIDSKIAEAVKTALANLH